MRLLESKKGRSCFAFEHNEEYQQTQHKFLAAVESMEPNNIVVRTHPGVGVGRAERPRGGGGARTPRGGGGGGEAAWRPRGRGPQLVSCSAS